MTFLVESLDAVAAAGGFCIGRIWVTLIRHGKSTGLVTTVLFDADVALLELDLTTVPNSNSLTAFGVRFALLVDNDDDDDDILIRNVAEKEEMLYHIIVKCWSSESVLGY